MIPGLETALPTLIAALYDVAKVVVRWKSERSHTSASIDEDDVVDAVVSLLEMREEYRMFAEGCRAFQELWPLWTERYRLVEASLAAMSSIDQREVVNEIRLRGISPMTDDDLPLWAIEGLSERERRELLESRLKEYILRSSAESLGRLQSRLSTISRMLERLQRVHPMPAAILARKLPELRPMEDLLAKSDAGLSRDLDTVAHEHLDFAPLLMAHLVIRWRTQAVHRVEEYVREATASGLGDRLSLELRSDVGQQLVALTRAIALSTMMINALRDTVDDLLDYARSHELAPHLRLEATLIAASKQYEDLGLQCLWLLHSEGAQGIDWAKILYRLEGIESLLRKGRKIEPADLTAEGIRRQTARFGKKSIRELTDHLEALASQLPEAESPIPAQWNLSWAQKTLRKELSNAATRQPSRTRDSTLSPKHVDEMRRKLGKLRNAEYTTASEVLRVFLRYRRLQRSGLI